MRREAVKEYLEGGTSLRRLERKFRISSSTIHRWVKQAEAAGGIDELERQELLRGELSAKQRGELSAKQRGELPADVKRLQKELEEARLYNRLLNAMIDIAEEQFEIPIRKKPGAKQS